MAGATLSLLDAILKDAYEGEVRENLYNETPCFQRFKSRRGNYRGRQVTFPVRLGRNQAVGARGDRGALPGAGHQTPVQAKVSCKYNYGSIELTGPVIKSSEGDSAAFVSAMTFEMDGMRQDLRRDLNRQICGDGRAVLAQCNGAGAPATTMVLDNPGTRFLDAGMIIDVYTAVSGGSQELNSITITTVDSSTQITIPSSTWSNDSYVFREDSRGNEMLGLRRAVDDGTLGATYHNISSTSYPRWKGQLVGNSGTNRSLTTDLMDQVIEKCKGGSIDLILCHPSVLREYAALALPDKRHVNTMKLDAGKKEVTFNGISMDTDYDLAWYEMLFLTTSTFRFEILADIEWCNDDGSILHKVTGYDAYEANMRFFGEFVCDHRAANGLLDDISATVVDELYA